MRRLILTVLIVLLFPIISLAGWEYDNTGTRYQNEDGTYKTGWYQDIDGKWYYLDDSTGYMLKNTTTPDGYIVNDAGIWVDAQNQFLSEKQYDNKDEFEVTSYKTYGSETLRQFGKTFPVSVNYNNRYEQVYRNTYKVEFEVLNFEVSKDGVLYIKYSAKDDNYYGELKVTTKYELEDGTCISEERYLGSWDSDDGGTTSKPIMAYHGLNSDPKPISAEVYIDGADVE